MAAVDGIQQIARKGCLHKGIVGFPTVPWAYQFCYGLTSYCIAARVKACFTLKSCYLKKLYIL